MLRVVPATGQRLLPALELLLSAWPAAARAARVAELQLDIASGTIDPQHVLLAEFQTRPVGAQLTIVRDDHVGMVWPPVVAEFRPYEAVEDALLREATRVLDRAGAWIGQALLEADQVREQAALQRNGFQRLTELRYFERAVSQLPPSPPRTPKPALSYETYRRSRNRLAFAAVLEQTYRGTLDCPELNGVRDGRQSLASHEAAGGFAPNLWRLYRRNGTTVGVLLMTPRPEQQAWEVLYLGVVAEARRSGVGTAMLRDALQAARDAQVKRLLIVADARNAPAIALYESLGFRQTDARIACVRLAPTLPRHRPDNAAGEH